MTESKSQTIENIESFLDGQKFDKLPRALFYLGAILRQVANAQSEKGHKTKPILNKIQFQGMNRKEVIWLYHELLEKLRQYEKMTPFREMLIKRFNDYYGTIESGDEINEQANVFYIMSGYAYLVGLSADYEKTNNDKEEVKS